MSSKRMIVIFSCGDDGLTFNEKEAIGKKELESSPIEERRWDFLRRMNTKEICGYTSFEVYERGHYFIHKCDSCGCEFNLPHQKNVCIQCSSEKIQSGKRKLGQFGPIKGVTGLYDGVHPDLLKAAQEDLRNNPAPGSQQPDLEPDWKYLEDNI